MGTEKTPALTRTPLTRARLAELTATLNQLSECGPAYQAMRAGYVATLLLALLGSIVDDLERLERKLDEQHD